MAERKPASKAKPKPPAKTPAAGKRGARRQAAATSAKTQKANTTAKRAKDAGATGGRLTSAKAALRDSMIVARAAQKVPWGDIAREAGVSARQCQRIVKHAQQVPSPVEQTPMQLVEDLVRGFSRSIADYEGMAFAWADTNQSASLGAKKAADETRARLAALLETVGKLPDNLELFRSEAEMIRLAEQMGEYLLGVREGTHSPEDAIEFFRSLVVRHEQRQLTAGPR